MESRAKAFGHPIHPMLIVLPLGLFIAAVIFDILYYITGNATLAAVAYYDIAAGILTGLLAAIFGLWDWLAIPGGTRAKSVGLWHGAGNVVIVLLFAISWWLRRGEPDFVPSIWAFILALVGVGLGALTGWLGGELVYRLRVAVDDGAHLDAPSSLSGEPATRTAAPR
ncbi:MAG TPA: DUF2231 domain-containing protein [Caldilineaceae bacterium]|nr:DUF2231 domain-containing protein [Caldilineaceae bacterium]